MRLIGYVPNESGASTFSDFLYVHGIHNQVEHDKEGWAIWIHSEDEIPKAKEFLQSYLGNPNDPTFQKHSRKAAELKERERQENEAAKKRTFDRGALLKASTPYRIGPLTVVFVVAACAVTGLSWTNPDKGLYLSLLISEHRSGLREIMNGEVWRLFTPALLHGGPTLSPIGIMHLVFNMMWLVDLGSMIEARENSRKLFSLMLIIGVLSNLAQWKFGGGPNFVGMSGVVYGLLGYLWMRGKFDPSSGLFLHQQTVMMMMIWFFACWFAIPNIANYAHTGGLVVGMAWGLAASFWSKRR
jgi:GlpG protein